MRRLSYLIDRAPEAPYYLLSLTYLMIYPPEESIYLFSAAFLFVIVSFGAGLTLKLALKTERPRHYCSLPAVEYDIPSLHTLISVGAAFFVYQINPLYGFILFPLALAYMYARIESGFHSKKAVAVGFMVGVLLGVMWANLNSIILIPIRIRTVLALLFFALPPFTAAFRMKHIKIGGDLNQAPVKQKM